MRRVIGSALAIALTACASGYGSGPPGGPVDRIPPKIVSTIPDTNATNVTQHELTIHFDKVISERPSAGQAMTLADLVIVSPKNGKPDVDWHRHDMVIHVRHGWRANTAYTVTILPGIADLRNNVIKHETTIFFSTGATIPATSLSGTIFDAITGAPQPGALIEAVGRPDSTLVYVVPADSTGRFVFHGVTPGKYLVRGYVDQNHNGGLDPIEAYDSTTLTLRDSTRTEFLTFVHDSLGPRLGVIDATDSVTLRATFSTPLIITQRLDTTTFALFAADSSRVPIRSVVAIREDTLGQVHDATQRHKDTSTVIVDSATMDTVVRAPPAPPAKPTRPLMIRSVLITVFSPLHPKTNYHLRAINVRGANGVVATSDHLFTTPAPPPPPKPHSASPSDTTAKARAAPKP